jgi:hypothetical protein
VLSSTLKPWKNAEPRWWRSTATDPGCRAVVSMSLDPGVSHRDSFATYAAAGTNLIV